MEFITQYFALLIFLWLIGAIVTSYFAKSKKRSFFQWLLIGLILGWAGIILVLILTREDKKFDIKAKEPIDRKLWYSQMKSEMQDSKKSSEPNES